MEKRIIGENLQPMEATIKYIKVIISLSLFFAVCPLFLLYKYLIYIILWVKYGKRFRGMMVGNDLIWSIEDNSRSIVMCLLVFEYDKEKNGDILETFQKHLHRDCILNLDPKMKFKRKYFMGYMYYVEREDDIRLSVVDSYETLDDIRKLVSMYSNQPMGEENDEFLEIIVGSKPINYNTDSKKEEYPIFVKIHHSLGDGISLLNLLVTTLSENPSELLTNAYNSFVKKQKTKITESEFNLAKMITKILKTGIYFFPIYAKKYKSKLFGPELSGKKQLVSHSKTEGYLEKIKYTKNRFQGCTFTAVLVTAISLGLNEFFEKKFPKEIPTYVPTNVIILPALPKFKDLITTKNNQIERIVLNNKFTICTLNIPFQPSIKNMETIFQSLADVKFEIDHLASSLDFYINKLFMDYLTVIPPKMVITYYMKYFGGGLAITNLPGLEKIKMFHGGYLQDFSFWIPNHDKTGLGISISSYDNRLKINMIGDEALLNSEELQEIVDNSYKYIDILYEESKQKKNINYKLKPNKFT